MPLTFYHRAHSLAAAVSRYGLISVYYKKKLAKKDTHHLGT